MQAVNKPERSGDRLERDLHGGQIRGLLLQKRERSPHRVERDRATRRGRGTPRLFDLEEAPIALEMGSATAMSCCGTFGIGLNRTERTSECFTS